MKRMTEVAVLTVLGWIVQSLLKSHGVTILPYNTLQKSF